MSGWIAFAILAVIVLGAIGCVVWWILRHPWPI